MTIYYHYDAVTRLCTGSSIVEAGDPIPDNAVAFAPPIFTGPVAVVLSKDSLRWDFIDDYRGCDVIDGDGNPVTITNVGPLPSGYTYIPYVEPGPSVEIVRDMKLKEVIDSYEKVFGVINSKYPEYERETWSTQLEEARAVLANNNTETPMLSILVEERKAGESVLEFAQIVINNWMLFRQFSAYMTGQQQRMYKEVNELSTVAELDAYIVEYDIPAVLQQYLGS